MKILYYVYLLDVYMAVANVAKERGFVFAEMLTRMTRTRWL